MRVRSPAKINLFFRVLRRREDGYHDIESVVQVIDLCDFLVFKEHSHHEVSSSDPHLRCDESNLVVKAVRLFSAHHPIPPLQIHIEKHIPMQSGLGGGSSNAATTLWVLNEWVGRPMTIEQLKLLASSLGSDVPLFFSQGSSYCKGRGEMISNCEIPPISGFLAKPDFGLATPLVYRETRSSDWTREPLLFNKSQVPYFNDLEPAALRLDPRLAAFKRNLYDQGFSLVSMTGSGTAFFCFGSSSRKEMTPFSFLPRSVNSWY